MNNAVFYNSPVGALLIEANETAITKVSFVNTAERVVADENSIPYRETDVPLLRTCMQQLDEYFNGDRFLFDLPLAQAGTAFQQSVWDQLQKIDYGKTLSYLSLSKKLGNAKAIRAVGTANGRNQVAIIVPCHRVIGNNGSLVGYAGDLWRKKWLLNHEAVHANGVQVLF